MIDTSSTSGPKLVGCRRQQPTLRRYHFLRYVDFWLLQNPVEDGQVPFWLPFDDVHGRAVPPKTSIRNARIDDYARQLSNVDLRGNFSSGGMTQPFDRGG